MMDIQPVQIAGIINVSESNYSIVFDSHKCMMLRQGFVPLFLINEIRSPRIHLLLGIILDIDLVNSILENHSYLFQVALLISSYFHCALKFEVKNRIWPAVTVKLITTDDMKTICLIKPQSLRVLLIDID